MQKKAIHIPAIMDWLKLERLDFDALLYLAGLGMFFGVPLGNVPMLFFGFLGLFVWIASGFFHSRGESWYRLSWSWPIFAIIFLHLLGLLYTVDDAGQSLRFAKKMHYWFYGFVVATINFNRFPASNLPLAFLIGLSISSFSAIIEVFAVLIMGSEMGMSLGIGPGFAKMSAFLVLGMLMLSFYFNNTSNSRYRCLFLILFGLYFLHLVLMQGRNGYLTFMILLPVMLSQFFNRLRFWQIALIYITAVGLMSLSPAVRHRMDFTVDQIMVHLEASKDKGWGRDYVPGEERFWMYNNAVEIFLENPILGVGTGGLQTAVKQHSKPNWPLLAHPHNNFLYMAVSFGLLGILALGWFFWELFKNSWRQRQSPVGFFIFSWGLVIFVSGVFNCQIVNAPTGFLLGITAGLQGSLPSFRRP